MKGQSEIGRGQMEPLDSAIDHVRGAPGGHLIVEYGDYECPYSRQAFGEITLVERRLDGELRYAGELGLDVDAFDRPMIVAFVIEASDAA